VAQYLFPTCIHTCSTCVVMSEPEPPLNTRSWEEGFFSWVLCFEKMRLSDLPGLAREPLGCFIGYLSSRSICLIDKGKMRHYLDHHSYRVEPYTVTSLVGSAEGNTASREACSARYSRTDSCFRDQQPRCGSTQQHTAAQLVNQVGGRTTGSGPRLHVTGPGDDASSAIRPSPADAGADGHGSSQSRLHQPHILAHRESRPPNFPKTADCRGAHGRESWKTQEQSKERMFRTFLKAVALPHSLHPTPLAPNLRSQPPPSSGHPMRRQ